MMAEVVRWAAAALADPATGLVATLPNLPLEVGDERPPLTVRVVNAFDVAWAARGDMPKRELEDGAVVVVRPVGETERAFMPADASGSAPLSIALHYGALGSTAHKEYLKAYGVLRTAQRVLTQQFTAAGADPEVTRNGLFIQRPTKLTWLPPFDEGDDAIISVACVIPVPVDDPWALGAPVS